MTPVAQPARSRAPIRRGAVGWLLDLAIGGVILSLLVNTWLVEGLFAPVIVASGSMAPALRGPHRAWRCAGCGHEFVCGLSSLPSPGTAAICPNCGTASALDAGANRPGDRVLVDRSAFLWRAPRRFEAVVFRCSENPAALCVKRVVGLSGELVEIRQGDIYIDGKIVAKDLPTGRAMATTVYHLPRQGRAAPALEKRWHADPEASWCWVDGRPAHGRAPEQRNTFMHPRKVPAAQWLTYEHASRFASHSLESSGVIFDESAYDQNESRVLNPTNDVMFRCTLQAAGRDSIQLRGNCWGDEFGIDWDIVSGEGELSHNGDVIALLASGVFPFRRPATIEWVLADQQVLVALDGRVLLEYEHDPAEDTEEGVPQRGQQFAIGVRTAEVKLLDAEVLRDVYYLPSTSGQAVYQLAADEYFLLGDNSPHSLDSREETPPAGIASERLIGRAVRW